MQVSKATSSIMRLFASLDIHYNNRQNTTVPKQNETAIKKLQTKLLIQSCSGFIAIQFFNRHQFFVNVQ